MNLTVLHAWSFPDEQLLSLGGRVALIIGVGIAWGFLPLVAPLLAKLV